MVPPFSERVDFIIRHAGSLRKLYYIVIDKNVSSNYSAQLLRTCITAVESSESKPRLSVATRRPILGTPLNDLLLYINDNFSLTRLDVDLKDTDNNSILEFLSRFHNLRVLEIWNSRSIHDNETDLDRFLGDLPLQEMTLHEIQRVASLPHQLKSLQLGSDGTPILTNSVWAAACNLKCLSKLEIECEDAEESRNEEPFIFKSSNLRTFSASLTAKTEEILRHQIIQPILVSCRQLTSIDLHINSSLSTTFLTALLSVESLKEVDIISAASPYTFQDFSALPRTLPNLEHLQLPWPASIGIPTNFDDEGRAMDWRFERNCSQDVPERLTFDQCRRLAEKFPKLNEIVFDMNPDALYKKYRRWSMSFGYNIKLDPPTIDLDKSRRNQFFKMATFIDEESPCLDLCSVFVYAFGNSDYTDLEGNPQKSMTLFLSLNQIGRHAGKR